MTTTIFTENFNNFTGSGFSPNPNAGQLDSDVWIVTVLSFDRDGSGSNLANQILVLNNRPNTFTNNNILIA